MLMNHYKKFIFVALCLTSLFIQASNVPVVFVHSVDSETLQATLSQARRCNDRVILIGDEANKHYAKEGIEYFPISDYNKSRNYFRTIYKHMSSADYELEFARFARWFVLAEFMQVHDLPMAFYAEDDVMLYCNMSHEYMTNFNDCDFALEIQHGFCDGAVSYWSSTAIESFCSFLKNFYEDKERLNFIEDQFHLGGEQYQDDWPHMTNWVHDNSKAFKIGNLNNLINNTTFDPSILHDYLLVPNAASVLEYKRYRMIDTDLGNGQEFLIKDILWNKGIPYCYSFDLGVFIQFKALKFQNTTRNLIHQFKSIPEIDILSPEPYQYVDILPFYMLGFFAAENLEKFIKMYKPKTIVELGSWLGASAGFMAFFMPADGKLYAVDHFNASLDSYHDQNVNIKKSTNNSDITALYHQFLSNIAHYKLCHKIIPIKMNTLEAARLLDVKADLIYVDASTDEESIYQDIMHWYPKLNRDGMICGDNWKWFESVRRGVNRAAQELGRTITVDNNFWYFDLIKE